MICAHALVSHVWVSWVSDDRPSLHTQTDGESSIAPVLLRLTFTTCSVLLHPVTSLPLFPRNVPQPQQTPSCSFFLQSRHPQLGSHTFARPAGHNHPEAFFSTSRRHRQAEPIPYVLEYPALAVSSITS